MQEIKEFEKGSTRTLLTADEANKIVKFLNNFLKMEFVPAGVAEVMWTEGKFVMTINAAQVASSSGIMTIRTNIGGTAVDVDYVATLTP